MIRMKPQNAQEAWEGMKSDYSAAKASKFRRKRNVPSMGAGGDYHYRSEADYFKIMEYARDMERNDAIAGPLVERAVTNIIQNGLLPDPKTGDPGADKILKARWWSWAGVGSQTSGKAFECSVDGEMAYRDMEKLVLRRMLVDGDIFPCLLSSGAVELVEGHRSRTPQRTKQNVIHGVKMDPLRRRQEYWFTRDEVDLFARVKVGDMEPRPAFDDKGFRTVLHIRNPKRPSQTRGMSAFTPVFDLATMHEDLNFAKLIQQQVASCIAFIRNRDATFAGGKIDPMGKQTQQVIDGLNTIIEQLAPGIELRGLPGEKIEGFSPNIPNAEYFQQIRLLLQLIGVNFGLPLVALMLDASDTNFSGWRGAMDQARIGFRDMQQHLIDHFESPVYVWRVRNFAADDSALRKLLPPELGGSNKAAGMTAAVDIFNHEWKAPRWPYVQPLQDAEADITRQGGLLAAPRRIHSDLSQDWDEVIEETVEDNGKAISKAHAKAKELAAEGIEVTWREVLFMSNVEMLKAMKGIADPPQPKLPGKTGDDDAGD